MKVSTKPTSHLLKGMVLLAFVVALPLGYQLWQNGGGEATPTPSPVIRPKSLLTVKVSGEIANPGVYELDPGTDIRQLLAMVQPRFPLNLIEKSKLDQTIEKGSHYQFSSRFESGVRITPLGVREKLVLSIPIDLNSASAEELDLLPYVSKNTARLIVEYRQQHGPIKDIDELGRIKGLRPKLTETLKKYTSAGDK